MRFLGHDYSCPVFLTIDIVLEKRGITADTAVRLAKFFGTSGAVLAWLAGRV
jgi:hypothetical protein